MEEEAEEAEGVDLVWGQGKAEIKGTAPVQDRWGIVCAHPAEQKLFINRVFPVTRHNARNAGYE
ncbi:MAG: hypothetical protein JXJ04_21130 [Spirochaetales bacterium]|nr:hypothetical protein [Spirochaetales bacterium]